MMIMSFRIGIVGDEKGCIPTQRNHHHHMFCTCRITTHKGEKQKSLLHYTALNEDTLNSRRQAKCNSSSTRLKLQQLYSSLCSLNAVLSTKEKEHFPQYDKYLYITIIMQKGVHSGMSYEQPEQSLLITFHSIG